MEVPHLIPKLTSMEFFTNLCHIASVQPSSEPLYLLKGLEDKV